VLAALLLCGSFLYPAWKRAGLRRLVDQMQYALDRGDYYLANDLATRLLERQSESEDGLRAAAESARMLGRNADALGHFRRLQATAGVTHVDLLEMGELSWLEHHPNEAERYFREAVEQAPRQHTARFKLVALFAAQCRLYDATAERQALLRQGVWTTEDLMFLGKPEDLVESPELEAMLRHNADNPHLLLAKARHARIVHNYTEAAEWLQKAMAAQPDYVEAHVDWGLLLLEQNLTEQALAEWHRGLPSLAESHPDVWFVRGFWAKMRSDPKAVARCFAEAVLRDPNHRPATHQLSLALATIGKEALASELATRVERLDELVRTIDQMYYAPESSEHWVRVAGLLESLGRIREAAAWYQTIAGVDRGNVAAQAKSVELGRSLSPDLPIVATQANIVLKLNIDAYPLPQFDDRRATVVEASAGETHAIRFSDVAHSSGLRFTFVGADQPVRRGRRIFEVFGAGIAVFDFDRDGWPDVYCAQGSSPNSRGEDRDCLFRNSGDATFVDITGAAGLGDDRFSQGVAIGDFDNDGFPDLLVANVGENRLYQNNGDGTFSEVTDWASTGEHQWTSSCAIADLNGDGLPDIYEVNYLGGKEVFSVICDAPGDVAGGSCRPRDFPAAADRFFLNNGDGQFVEQTTQAGFVGANGRGLGLVVADFEGAGRLSVFVANDTTANHFYMSQAARGKAPSFIDRARLMGLAFDRNGLSQACMGVGVEDIDDDGRLDLFVTNFQDEANTLYRGLEGGYFEDATSAVGLHTPSLSVLGFGTQFIDADLDGDADLAVVNGHITSSDPSGADFQMRPQFFENRAGRFSELRGSDVGTYFDRRLLGRALVRLDFDRDGREDIAISHLDAPLALLHNDTQNAGHFLVVRLCGVTSDRDAIGATVTVVTGSGQRRVGQVTAGDGYMCSNQRQLVFGLAAESTIEKLVVRWPSGALQEFTNMAVDRHWIIVEGRAEPAEITK
jgi:tetratricopeptide (TPR) repeat protein